MAGERERKRICEPEQGIGAIRAGMGATEPGTAYEPSAATSRAQAADARVFTEWCRTAGREAWPATPETVAAFLAASGGAKAPATLRRYRSSLAALHRAVGWPDPCATTEVRRAIARTPSTGEGRRRRVEPLDRDAVERMMDAVDPRSSRLLQLRDAALLAVAYDTMLPRSKLVELRVDDLERGSDGGGTLFVRSPPHGGGGERDIRHLSAATLVRVDAYLRAGRLEAGPLFRAVDKGGRPSGTPLEAQEVRRLVGKLAALAGVRTIRAPSAHSMRSGAAREMLAAGFPLGEVMRAGGWATEAAAATAAAADRIPDPDGMPGDLDPTGRDRPRLSRTTRGR